MRIPSLKHWPRLTRLPLSWEITLVLLVKLVIILAIRQAFFSKPQAKKMVVPMPEVEQHLLSAPGVSAEHAPQRPSPEPDRKE